MMKYLWANRVFPRTAQKVALKFTLYFLLIFSKKVQDSLFSSGHCANYIVSLFKFNIHKSPMFFIIIWSD
jgi:hypothetical protein